MQDRVAHGLLTIELSVEGHSMIREVPERTRRPWILRLNYRRGVRLLVLRATRSSEPLPNRHDAARAEEERGAHGHLRGSLHRLVEPEVALHQLVSDEHLETYREEIDSDDRDRRRLDASRAVSFL